MSLRELFNGNSGRIKYTTKGATCHRELIGPWDEALSDAPTINSPHPDLSFLLVKEVEFVPEGAIDIYAVGNRTEEMRVLIDYTYEYQRPVLGDPARISYATSTEALMTGMGRVWDDCSEVVEADQIGTAQPFTMLKYCMDVAVTDFPIADILQLVNKVNDDVWNGADAGTVLFTDFTQDSEYDWETELWYSRVRYEFVWRMRPHNEIWRAPIPTRDAGGAIQYYQGSDPAGPNYTTDAALQGHPFPKTGTAGTAAWTTLTPPLYEEGDFSTLVTV